MEDLYIARKRYTPEIRFKASGELSITGVSLLENSYENYSSAMSWLRKFGKLEPRPVTLDLKYIYVDTSSMRSVVDIIKLLNTFKDLGFKIQINWYFEKDDEDHFDVGEALKSIALVDFSLIEIGSDEILF